MTLNEAVHLFTVCLKFTLCVCPRCPAILLNLVMSVTMVGTFSFIFNCKCNYPTEACPMINRQLSLFLRNMILRGCNIVQHCVQLCFAEGILVASSINGASDDYYQSNLYHISYSGVLKAVLPFLGKGPHSFFPIHLSENMDLSEKHPDMPYDEEGWYVVLRDGYGAICCVRISASST